MSDKIKSNPMGRGERKPENRETFKTDVPQFRPKPSEPKSK